MSIILDNVSYVYGQNEGYIKQALKDINLVIGKNEFIGLIGHTGSGKSTMTQILNGLLVPTTGNMYFEGFDTKEKNFNKKELRQKVGLVFQYPEHQLFETTVFKDVCFGPKNMGLSQKECELRAFEALTMVGFDSELFYQSPFELSGGQKRRVAIAGVMAMKPEYIVLDEPTAGLDPVGRDEILGMIKEVHEKTQNTIVLVSHSMEDVAKYVDRIVVMNDGRITFDDTPQNVFSHYKELEKIGLAAPKITYIMNDLKKRGFDVKTDALTIEEGIAEITERLQEKGIF